MSDAEQRFSQIFPAYDKKKVRRTKAGNPYVFEEGEFEPGTFGQASYDKPMIRLSPKAAPYELAHEEAHLDDWYHPEGVYWRDKGYNLEGERAKYLSSGLTPEDADYMAYASRPSEINARTIAGDPAPRFAQLQAQVAELLKKRMAGRAAPAAPRPRAGGLGGAAAAEAARRGR